MHLDDGRGLSPVYRDTFQAGKLYTKSDWMRRMKSLSLLFLGLAAMTCCGATAVEVRTTGDWSAPVDGLRGRLHYGEGETVNGTRMALIYLELQNVSDLGNPMEIYFDIDRALQADLLDASGKSLPQSGSSADITNPPSYWISLPHDSTLRFRVSVTGYGIPKDGGLSIGLMSGDWRIPYNSRDDRFLSASLSVNPPKDHVHTHPWKGDLKLPRLKIPAPVR
jgi:hypothetical protein